MIRFDEGFVRYLPIPTFDGESFPFDVPMLFPYWSKIDTVKSFCSDSQDCYFDYANRSTVFYQNYTEDMNTPNSTYILNKASQEVRNNSDFSSFSASWVLVVTWLRLRPDEEFEEDNVEEETVSPGLRPRRGGGVLPKNFVGVGGPLPKTITLFMTSLQANL